MVSNIKEQGFTLIELMIVIAVIGVLTAIAVPNYQRYVIKTKRVDMMTSMQNIGSQIQSRKMALGGYTDPTDSTKANTKITTGLAGEYPQNATKLYDVTINLDSNNDKTFGDWIITAIPKTTGQLKNDGTLTLNDKNIKCRGTDCGTGSEWNK